MTGTSGKRKRRRIFCLPPVKLWRNICFGMALSGLIAAVAGTVFIEQPLAIHWGASGQPNGYGGTAILWELELLAVLCMFAYSGCDRKRIGQIPVNREVACALTAGMTSTFALVNVMIVMYGFHPDPSIPVIGCLLIIAVFMLFVLAAHFRSRRGSN